MPVRNVVHVPLANTFYHVYNRGHNKDLLFFDEEDYQFFEWLLERSFGLNQLKSKAGKLFPWFGDNVSLISYCLMPNHFHLLLFQKENEQALAKAMQSLATTYSLYFNRLYERRGSAFESVYKSVPALDDEYLMHITRYIHLNPTAYETWEYSSYRDYLGGGRSWINCQFVLDLFNNVGSYQEFVGDYKDLHDELDDLKHGLADNGESY